MIHTLTAFTGVAVLTLIALILATLIDTPAARRRARDALHFPPPPPRRRRPYTSPYVIIVHEADVIDRTQFASGDEVVI